MLEVERDTEGQGPVGASGVAGPARASATVVAGANQPDRRRDRLTLAALLLGLAAFYLLTMSGHLYARDEETLYYVAEGLVEGRGFTISPQAPLVNAARGRDGQVYAQHPPGQALAALPLYLAGRLAAAPLPAELRPFVTRLYVQTFNVWITAALGTIVAALALAWGARRSVAVVVALLLGLTTMQWVYARTFFAEPLTALLGLTSLYLMVRVRAGAADRWLILAGLAAGAALLVKPHALLTWPALALYLTLARGWPDGRWRWPGRAWWSTSGRATAGGLALWLAGLLPPLLLQLIYNTLIFGGPLTTGNTAGGDVTFDAIFYEGLYGLTLSSGKGLIFYAPIVVVAVVAFGALARRDRWAALALAVLAVAHPLAFSAYRLWYGGGAWGPRFLLLMLPALVLPLAPWLDEAAGRRARRWLAVAALGLAGLAVQVVGVATNFDTPIVATEDTARFFVPSQSPIVLQVRLAAERWRQWATVLAPGQGTAILLAGFSREGLPPGEPRAVLPFRALPELVVRVVGRGGGDLALTVEMEEAAVQARWDGRPVTPVVTPLPNRPGRQTVTASLPGGGGDRHELRLLVSRPTGAGPEPPVVSRFELTDERGRLALVQWPYIPPMPPQPLRRWQWFHLPAIPHLADHWLWYLYASGQPPAVILAVAAPLLVLVAGLALAAGLCWWRLRRSRVGRAASW